MDRIQWQIFVYAYAYEYCHNISRKWTVNQLLYLTFRGPCIVICSYNKSQRDALFLKFILIKNSTCFEQIYCPSSGVFILHSQKLAFVILVMLTVCQQTVNITSITNTNRCEYSINLQATNVIYIYIYMEHPFLMFLDHTQRRSTVGRTPLDE